MKEDRTELAAGATFNDMAERPRAGPAEFAVLDGFHSGLLDFFPGNNSGKKGVMKMVRLTFPVFDDNPVDHSNFVPADYKGV